MIPWLLTQLGASEELREQPWRLAFERPAPPWLWVVGLLVVGGAAAYSYAGVRGPRTARAALASLRAATLLLIAWLAMLPVIEWPRERTDPDHVEVLIDRSGSMRTRDASVDGGRATRAAAQEAALRHPVWGRIAAEHAVDWIAFAGSARPLPRLEDLPAAEGGRTLIGSALHETLQRSAGRTLSAVVLLSDGRSQDEIAPTTLRQLQSAGVPVFVIPLGDPQGGDDKSVLAVEAPQTGFLQDQIPIQVRLAAKPGAAIRVALKDLATGKIVDQQGAVAGPDGRAAVTLIGQGSKAGDATWEVAILDAPDADPSNDTKRVDITMIDRPIRVLYLDGWPRWEFRYIRNILLRETGVESSIMLMSADRDFAQEGTTPLARLPRTEQEFAAFDVVILGDVTAGFLDATQQKAIRELVATRGAGLLWIGGERSTPSSWRGAALEDLLPFRAPLDLPRLDQPAHMEPTAAAAGIGLLRLGSGRDGEEAWPKEIAPEGEPWARLEWVQRIDEKNLKPTTEILARAVTASDRAKDAAEAAHGTPVVMTMRYGAGQCTYVATDETWRWRYARGETLPERFWIQLIRHLARSGLRNSEGVALQVEPRKAATGQPVRIAADLAGASATSVVVEAKHDRSGRVVDVALRPDGGERFSAVWIPPLDGEGEWSLRIQQPAVDHSPEARLLVAQEEIEQADTTPDHALLEKIAAATKGRMIAAADLDGLDGLLPRRSITTRQPIRIPLWNHWPFFAGLAILMTGEWVGRKLLRLS